MKIVVDKSIAGKTIKEYLFTELGLSRAQVCRLKNNNGIRVNSSSVTVRYRLLFEDILELQVEDREEDINSAIEGVYHELDILYEDDDVICVNKPSGMATHPSHNHHGDTLANALVYYFNEKNIPFVFRAVNRLDRETSGVVLVAKNRQAAYKLSDSLKKGKFKKEYYALVCGIPENEKGEIEKYIVRREDSIIFRKAAESGKDSEYAKTIYERIEDYSKHSLLKVFPVTGRTHQIRVHLSSIGHPVYGDGLYGEENECGLMLHAYSLEFVLPQGKILKVCAPLPERFNIIRRKDEI